jgi:hypothetical protein
MVDCGGSTPLSLLATAKLVIVCEWFGVESKAGSLGGHFLGGNIFVVLKGGMFWMILGRRTSANTLHFLTRKQSVSAYRFHASRYSNEMWLKELLNAC